MRLNFPLLVIVLITLCSQHAFSDEIESFCAKHSYSNKSYDLCVQSGLQSPQLQACVDSAVTENKYSGCLEIASRRALPPRIIYGCAGHTFGKTAFFACLNSSL